MHHEHILICIYSWIDAFRWAGAFQFQTLTLGVPLLLTPSPPSNYLKYNILYISSETRNVSGVGQSLFSWVQTSLFAFRLSPRSLPFLSNFCALLHQSHNSYIFPLSFFIVLRTMLGAVLPSGCWSRLGHFTQSPRPTMKSTAIWSLSAAPWPSKPLDHSNDNEMDIKTSLSFK